MNGWDAARVKAHNERVAQSHGVTTASNPIEIIPTKTQKTFIIKIEPMGAPRMTQQDKWLKPRRPCIARYFKYQRQIQHAVGDLPFVPDCIDSVFYLPMPDTWSEKKKAEMEGSPHKQRPDRDNLDKGVMDSLFLEDGGVWSGSQQKYWVRAGSERIELVFTWL